MATGIVTNLIGFTQVGGSLLDIATACHEDLATEKVDNIVQQLLKDSDPYHSLMDKQKKTEFLSLPRRLTEGGIAVVSIVEGASIPIEFFSTTSNTLSSISAVLTSTQAAATFLSCGILAAIFSAIDGVFSAYKAFQFNKEIDNVKAAKEALGNEGRDIQAFLDKELEILSIRRNESYKDVAFAVAIIALFIIANVVFCGIPALATLGILAIAICVIKLINNRKTDAKVALLSKQLVSSRLYHDAAKQLANLRYNPFILPNQMLINKTGQEIIKGLIIAYRESGELNEFNATLVKFRHEDLQLPAIHTSRPPAEKWTPSFTDLINGLTQVFSCTRFPLAATIS